MQVPFLLTWVPSELLEEVHVHIFTRKLHNILGVYFVGSESQRGEGYGLYIGVIIGLLG